MKNTTCKKKYNLRPESEKLKGKLISDLFAFSFGKLNNSTHSPVSSKNNFSYDQFTDYVTGD